MVLRALKFVCTYLRKLIAKNEKKKPSPCVSCIYPEQLGRIALLDNYKSCKFLTHSFNLIEL